MFNRKENQNCWNCNHFQRYASDDKFNNIFGECRAHSQSEQHTDTKLSLYNWPFVKDSLTNWCSSWKKSVLDVPVPPVTQNAPDWPYVWKQWVPWNVKADLNISCWNCSHFQRDDDVPVTQNGVCAKQYPSKSNALIVGTNADFLDPRRRLNYPGTLYWCGNWQASEVTVPAAPAIPDSVRPLSWIDISGGEIEWHLDPILGSDETGDGSVNAPFASFHCLNNLPNKLYNKVVIKPVAGNYDYFPESIIHEFFQDGSITIDASSQTFPIIDGPFTVGTVTNVGAAGPFGKSLATDLTVAAAGWTPDDYAGKFIRVLTGNWIGYVIPVYKNDSDTITLPPDWETFQVGDTFEFVDCPVQITTPNSVLIRGNMESNAESGSGSLVSVSPYAPTFLMCGIQINANSNSMVKKPFRFELCSFVLSACILQNDWDGGTPSDKTTLELYRGSINAASLPNGTFDNDSFSDWTKYHLIVNKSTGISEPDKSDISLVSALMYTTMCRGSIWSTADNAQSGVTISISQCGQILSYGPRSILDHIYIDQLADPQTCISGLITNIRILSVYIRNGGQPIILAQQSFCFSGWFQGATISGSYALQCSECSNMVLEDTDTTILGATGAIDFLFSATQHVAWPGTGAMFTDSAGSWVMMD